jgi:hypothetical protein
MSDKPFNPYLELLTLKLETPAEAWLLQRHADGASLRQLAREVGVVLGWEPSHQTVANWLATLEADDE